MPYEIRVSTTEKDYSYTAGSLEDAELLAMTIRDFEDNDITDIDIVEASDP